MKDNTSLLLDKIKTEIILSDAEVALLTSLFFFTIKKKNDFLSTEGSVPSYLYFIIDGYMRFYHIDENGHEITTQIVGKNDLITSFEGFVKETPSKEYIQCLSESTLLRISKKDYDRLNNEITNWTIFCQAIYETHILKISRRVHSLLNLSASNRYLNLLKYESDLALNIPVKYLASYLGIKPQSLSRIRKDIK